VIDARAPFASWFLWCAGAGMLVFFAIPLLLFPLRWARWFGWKIPAETDLVVYFGRCVGGLAIALIYGAFRGAPAPGKSGVLFDVILAALALMVVVHVWGALRRAQPWTENAEIVLYALLFALAFAALRTL
jgi:hypothetical protein